MRGLRFEKVACLRGGRLLFEGLDFALVAGEAGLVTGPNGIGKSSLLRIAAGLLRPAAGIVQSSGGVAWIGEEIALDARLPLARALEYWARLDGGHVAAGLAAMALDRLAAVPVRMLSAGQRRRAALARVIASGAGIWLLDEPGNGLDVDSLARLGAAMAAHRQAGGIILAATHQPLGLGDAQPIVLGG